jgi:hypothetical protein
LQSQIKIVKRKPDQTQTDSQTHVRTKPVELSTREITIVVKKWIAELKERKRVTTVIGNQASREVLQ